MQGAVYPVMNRGDRREPIFRDDEDRRQFLETFGRRSAKPAGRCMLLPHAQSFHLAVETLHGNLVAAMKWFWALTRDGSTGGTSCSVIFSAVDTRR